MTDYYRPIVRVGPDRPADAQTLAGGACWFDEVALHRRGASLRYLPAGDLPHDVRDHLCAPREGVAGVAMDRPHLMGILNVTPDSFSDGGRFDAPAAALDHAIAMQAAGAAIIDIGGESTRPGAATVPNADEIARTAPVIAAIGQRITCPISIDTRKADVAQAAIMAGALIVNDVAALTYDRALADIVANADVPVCLMHAQGAPQTMQDDPRYDDVLLDVYDFLQDRVAAAVAAGIRRDRIILDPGIGFGKTVAHNLALLQGVALFHGLGCTLLVGASRKRFIGSIGGGAETDDRLGGSVAVALSAARQGVQILRVHDIAATRQALDLDWAILGAGA